MAGLNHPGLNIFAGIPPLPVDIAATTGAFLFVGSTAVPGGLAGADSIGGYGDRPQRPLATLDYAIGQCVAGRGDTIVVLPGHAETVTTAITLDVASVNIVGLGQGRNRPAFTRNADIDMFTVTAANCRIHNLRMVSTATTTNSLLNIAEADLHVSNCIFEHGTGPLMAVTVEAAGDRFTFENCRWIGTAAGPDVCIDLEAKNAGHSFRVLNCEANYAASAGLDLAFIRNAADTTIGGLIKGLVVIGVDATVVDFNSSLAAAGEGLICDVHACTSGSVTMANTFDVGGYHLSDARISETAATRAIELFRATTA